MNYHSRNCQLNSIIWILNYSTKIYTIHYITQLLAAITLTILPPINILSKEKSVLDFYLISQIPSLLGNTYICALNLTSR